MSERNITKNSQDYAVAIAASLDRMHNGKQQILLSLATLGLLVNAAMNMSGLSTRLPKAVADFRDTISASVHATTAPNVAPAHTAEATIGTTFAAEIPDRDGIKFTIKGTDQKPGGPV